MNNADFLEGTGRLRVGERIGRGGEGEVYALDDGTMRVLKLYLEPDGAREAKVRRMISEGLSEICAEVAFPTGLAFRSNGAFAGFTMRRVANAHPVHELYSPAARRRLFPNADWRFLVRAASNVARVFAKIHAAGVVVGDVNGSGVLLSRRATAVIIDADSFHLGPDHPCRVGVPEFTPPELQRRSLDGVTRTSDHDAFGLAVLIFHLLFLGRHPHAGISPTRDVPLAEAIRCGRFAYSRLRETRLSPPPRTLLLTDLPLGVRLLFERAFAVGIGPRPRATEWVAELAGLERSLAGCSRNDRHLRYAEARECPWCRIERAGAGLVFGAGGTGAACRPPAAVLAMSAEIGATLARARLLAGEAVEPKSRRVKVQASDDAREYGSRGGGAHLRALVAGAAAAKGACSGDHFTRRYMKARKELARALDAWRDRAGIWKLNRRAESLAADLRRFVELHGCEAREMATRRSAFREAQLRKELARRPIDGANLPGIGRARLASLADAGMVTAADLSRTRLCEVPRMGEGAIASLLMWRDALTVRCLRETPEAALPPDVADEIRSRCERKTADAEGSLRRSVDSVMRLADDISRLCRDRDAGVDAARVAVAQAVADLDLLGLPIPPNVPPVPATKPKNKKTPGPKPGSCPLCGGPMAKRWAHGGSAPNRYFLGCANYPRCSGSRPLRGTKP